LLSEFSDCGVGWTAENWGVISMKDGDFLYHCMQIGSGVHTYIQWIPQALSPGVKWLGCEADHLLLTSSARVMNVCSYTTAS
jgi:hypothetical protein